jgi:hypothetical protein
MSTGRAPTPPTRSRLKLAAGYEAGIWRSLYRWLTRRPRSTDPDAALFGYASQVTPLLIAFIAVSSLEIPAVSLLFPWPAVRYPLLIVGVWGLLWMLGLLASVRTHPHVITDAGLQLRSGFQFDARLPWEQISAIRLRRSSTEQKLQIEHNEKGTSVALQGTSNVEVLFRGPLTVRFNDGRDTTVDAIHFYTDTPAAFFTAAHAHLARIREAHDSVA